MNRSQALVSFDQRLSPANGNEEAPWARLARIEAELQAHEPVLGAAVMVVAAFRLRDEAGLIDTLRLLAQAVGGLEAQDAAADD